MPKLVLRGLVGMLVVAGIAAAVWYGFFQEGSSENGNLLRLYGNVDIRQVELAFNGSERIADIRVEEGQSVKKGDLLAVLETERLESAVARAEAQMAAQQDVVAKLEAGTRIEEIRRARAQVAVAKTRASDAQRTWQRLEPLAQKSLASRERADEARARAESAAAQLEASRQELELALAGPRKEDIAAARSRLRALEAELALAKRNLADADLVAPSHGVIRNRILQPGDMAFPQRPVLTLALTDPVWVRTYIPAPQLGKIFPGMEAHIRTDSYPEKRYRGWIGYISPTAEFTPKAVETPELRTRLVYQVRVYACNPQNELRLGMPATVEIPLDQSRSDAKPLSAVCGEEG